MSRDQFMKEICRSPGDYSTRKIFADWLEENEDPDRAIFIRLQCEMETIKCQSKIKSKWKPQFCGGCKSCKYRLMLGKESFNLYLINQQKWYNDDTTVKIVHEIIGKMVYRGGFVEEIRCTWETCNDSLSELRLQYPLRSATVATEWRPDFSSNNKRCFFAISNEAIGFVDVRMPQPEERIFRHLPRLRGTKSKEVVHYDSREQAFDHLRQAFEEEWKGIKFHLVGVDDGPL